MENTVIPDYLYHPTEIQRAIINLERNSHLSLVKRYNSFNNDLGIQLGDGFPVTYIYVWDNIFRARINRERFTQAKAVDEIGTNFENFSEGRCNPPEFPVFYGSSSESTAAFEVLQEKAPGIYIVTIGCWSSHNEKRCVNLIDGSDLDFNELQFAHSMLKEYLKIWPTEPRISVQLLTDYAVEKFKSKNHPGLYSITNVLSGIFYSLYGVDGIAYAAVSNKFKGFNIALKASNDLKCKSVQKWLVEKVDNNTHHHKLLEIGTIKSDGSIKWRKIV